MLSERKEAQNFASLMEVIDEVVHVFMPTKMVKETMKRVVDVRSARPDKLQEDRAPNFS